MPVFLLAYRISRPPAHKNTQNTPHPHPAPTAARTQDESEIGKGTLRVPYHHRRCRRPHHHRPPCSPLPPHHEPDGGLGSQQPFKSKTAEKEIKRASANKRPESPGRANRGAVEGPGTMMGLSGVFCQPDRNPAHVLSPLPSRISVRRPAPSHRHPSRRRWQPAANSRQRHHRCSSLSHDGQFTV